MKNFIFVCILIFIEMSCTKQNQSNQTMTTTKIEFLNPEEMHHNPAFSQAVVLQGSYKTIYIGGQNAVDKNGKIVGKDNIELQAKQVLHNLEIVLKASDASINNIIKWNVYIVQGESVENTFKIFQSAMKDMKNPPLITMAYVAALGNPDFLMEVEAIAIVPEK